MNLKSLFSDLFISAERELIWLLGHILGQKVLKRWEIQCLIVSDYRYKLVLGKHLGTKIVEVQNIWLAQSRTEIHPGKGVCKMRINIVYSDPY